MIEAVQLRTALLSVPVQIFALQYDLRIPIDGRTFSLINSTNVDIFMSPYLRLAAAKLIFPLQNGGAGGSGTMGAYQNLVPYAR